MSPSETLTQIAQHSVNFGQHFVVVSRSIQPRQVMLQEVVQQKPRVSSAFQRRDSKFLIQIGTVL